jgi:hypothetical protein
MDCGICLEAMAVPSYRAAAASASAAAASATSAAATASASAATSAESPDETLDHGHSRFVCGHAFHAACAVQALLNGSPRCPSCRTSWDPRFTASAAAAQAHDADADDGDTPILFRSALDANANMSYHPIMRRVRSRYSDVQQRRRELRERISSYNRLQDRMRHARRAAIQEALGAFRRRHYEACNAAIHGVQDALEDVIDAERKGWERESGAPPSGAEWVFYTQQTAPELVADSRSRAENLLDRRFWSLR